MEHLTVETFKEKVFNWEESKDWKYKGELPCIIDFYADWCGPCKMVAPVLEELSKEYDGKVSFYKVDTEDQQELAGLFGISSIPTFRPAASRSRRIAAKHVRECHRRCTAQRNSRGRGLSGRFFIRKFSLFTCPQSPGCFILYV